MPTDLTIFGATYLVYIEAVAALVLSAYLLYRRPRAIIVYWVVTVIVMLLLSFIAAQIAANLYNDPRPFAVDHFHPLISHAADNGFPSDHGLLAAALVAAVALRRIVWSLLLAPIAVLVDWARVGAGVHHPIDVIGSTVCVLIAAVIALLVAPTVARVLLPHIPGRLLDMVAAPEGTSGTPDRL